MHNYHNIIPVIILDVLIILIFEGLLFFLYLEKQQENIINRELNKFFEKIKTENQQNNLFTILNQIFTPHIEQSMYNEEQFISKQYKNGIIIYSATLLGLVISLLIYSYVVYKVLYKSINWGIVCLTVIITIILIIIMEALYVKYVLFYKKFNESQIKLDFVNALQS